jgi:glycosyltransferase involved in cell wall biosynthesis
MTRLSYVVGYPLRDFGNGQYTMSAYAIKLTDFPTSLFHEVTMLAPAELVPESRFEKRVIVGSNFPNLRVVQLPMSASRLTRCLRQFPIIWRSVGKADLVCVNIPEEASFLAACICRIRSKPLLVQVIGDWGPAVLVSGTPTLVRKIKAIFGSWMARFTVRSADLVFTQGKALYDKYHPENPPAVRSPIVHTTLATSMFFKQDDRPFNRPLRLLSVSRLTPGKGLDLLIQAVELLAQRGIDAEWWCVGTGPQAVELEQLAKTKDIQGVRFFGFLEGEKLLQAYRDADMFVLPSYTEGIPNVMLEAMAQSLPVIMTAVGGIPTVLEDGVDGLLIAPRSVEAIVDAVCRLDEDRELTNRLRRAAYRKALTYRMDELSREHEALIRETFGDIASPNSSQSESECEVLLEK